MTDNLNYSDVSKISHVSFTRTARSDSLMREVLSDLTLGTLRLRDGNNEDERCVAISHLFIVFVGIKTCPC